MLHTKKFPLKICFWKGSQKFGNTHRKTPASGSLFNKAAGLEALFIRDSSTVVFPRILWNPQEHPSWRTSLNGCFWQLIFNQYPPYLKYHVNCHNHLIRSLWAVWLIILCDGWVGGPEGPGVPGLGLNFLPCLIKSCFTAIIFQPITRLLHAWY